MGERPATIVDGFFERPASSFLYLNAFGTVTFFLTWLAKEFDVDRTANFVIRAITACAILSLFFFLVVMVARILEGRASATPPTPQRQILALVGCVTACAIVGCVQFFDIIFQLPARADVQAPPPATAPRPANTTVSPPDSPKIRLAPRTPNRSESSPAFQAATSGPRAVAEALQGPTNTNTTPSATSDLHLWVRVGKRLPGTDGAFRRNAAVRGLDGASSFAELDDQIHRGVTVNTASADVVACAPSANPASAHCSLRTAGPVSGRIVERIEDNDGQVWARMVDSSAKE